MADDITRVPLDFDAMYEGTPPWDLGRPQGAFQALAEAGQIRGRVLDVGCGTGEHALMAARLGLEVTGIDLAARAIEQAARKSKERGIPVRFVAGDALRLEGLGGQFDTVLDCGFFHVLGDRERQRLERSLHSVVASGGAYFMLCFSDLVPGDAGPRRIRQEEIRRSFGEGWQVESIELSKIESTLGPIPVPAWLARIRRV